MSNEKKEQSLGKWLREPQTMIGLSALVLSICGLFIAFYEASIIREHQRASVWPYVDIAYSFQENHINFHISNTGIGPARIEAANITYKGEVVNNWESLIDSMNLRRNIEQEISGISSYISLINGQVLPANSRFNTIFRLDFENMEKGNKTVYQNFSEHLENEDINIAVCYCSVYDQCWITEMIVDEHTENDNSPERNIKMENCEDVENSTI